LGLGLLRQHVIRVRAQHDQEKGDKEDSGEYFHGGIQFSVYFLSAVLPVSNYRRFFSFHKYLFIYFHSFQVDILIFERF